MSAVSKSVMPRSSARWITLREPSRSTRWPKLLQPRPTAETRKPEPPRLRICIDFSPLGEDERNDALCRAHPHPARRGPATLLQLRSAQPHCRKVVKNGGPKKVRPRSDAATDGDRWGA